VRQVIPKRYEESRGHITAVMREDPREDAGSAQSSQGMNAPEAAYYGRQRMQVQQDNGIQLADLAYGSQYRCRFQLLADPECLILETNFIQRYLFKYHGLKHSESRVWCTTVPSISFIVLGQCF